MTATNDITADVTRHSSSTPAIDDTETEARCKNPNNTIVESDELKPEVKTVGAADLPQPQARFSASPMMSPGRTSCSPQLSAPPADFRSPIADRYPIYGGGHSSVGRYFPVASSGAACDVMHERHQSIASGFVRDRYNAPSTPTVLAPPSSIHSSRETLLAEVCETMSRMRNTIQQQQQQQQQGVVQFDSIL